MLSESEAAGLHDCRFNDKIVQLYAIRKNLCNRQCFLLRADEASEFSREQSDSITASLSVEGEPGEVLIMRLEPGTPGSPEKSLLS